jgi:hypothetical protein
LNLSLVRHDLDDAAVAVLEHRFPGLGVRLAAAARPGVDGRAGGGTHRTPWPPAARLWITGRRVQQLHPGPGTAGVSARYQTSLVMPIRRSDWS